MTRKEGGEAATNTVLFNCPPGIAGIAADGYAILGDFR